MSDKTGISWTDATWNPVRGCSRVSEGCRHCYAERVAARFSGPGQPYEGLIKIRKSEVINYRETLAERKTIVKDVEEPRWNGKVRFVTQHLADPLRWKKPRRIFVNSMSDLFHESLTNEQIAAVFGVMAACPQHTFQVLTKRARRMREWFSWVTDHGAQGARSACRVSASDIIGRPVESQVPPVGGFAWPLHNIWLGVSVENQAAADERILDLLATPAAVRFLSCEPLLRPIDLAGAPAGRRLLAGACGSMPGTCEDNSCRTSIDWVIAGCESGSGARPADVAWFRSLRDQCAAAGVPFFLKQAVGTRREFVAGKGDGCVGMYASEGSKRKPGGVIELPYLDGVQHAAFPEVKP